MGKGGQNFQSQKIATKPSRSDEILDAEQQLLISSQIRSHFEALAPRRPRKPNRSETDEGDHVAEADSDAHPLDMDIPELKKLQQLNSQQDQLVFGKDGAETYEEFVETDYYKDLNAVDKVHHATGSGFIKVDLEETGSYFRLSSDGDGGFDRIPVRCNPACNDWIPATEVSVGSVVSNKPVRSG